MDEKPRNSLMRYAGFATQLLVGLLVAAYAGKWIDKQFSIGFPVLIWLLPLLLLIVMLIKVVKDTSKK